MSSRYRVLLTDRPWPDSQLERELLARFDAELIDAPNGDEPTLVSLARDCDAIAVCWANVTANVIRAAPRCRVVSRVGVGLDNISVETATELGIPVTNVPDYCVPEVCDHTLALILACARKVAFYNQQAKSGVYELQAGAPLRRLTGQTLGLVGFGRIARAVFDKAQALGLEVIAHSRSNDDYGTGCRMTSLNELLAASDYISLHAPLSAETADMFAAAQFAAMKPTAYLINTSRGGLIDHTALWSALRQGQIAGAALDVFDPEPPDLSQPLYLDPRVIVTPHAAFLSEESLRELRTRAMSQVATVLRGKRPEHVVNPEVYA
jgi:D-3-phosphoglycerate dehydrogenase